MKRPIALITAAAAVAVPVTAVGKPKRKHVPGCNTPGCDSRIGARWAAKHRRPDSGPVIASWYGPGLYGNPLGCGGTLTPGTAGVANKELPCGQRVRICLARRGGGCAGPVVITRVIDRGPYVAGRTFDLTAPTRNAIGMGGGTAAVRYAVG